MKHVRSDKYNVAWFALAECISRGEKERALGVYRLLSHSIDDPALKSQLEADILWSFNDQKAIKKYQDAAETYKKEQHFLEAAAVFEHLVVLVPDSLYYLDMLIALYKELGCRAKATQYAMILIALACKQKDLKKAIEVMEQVESNLELSQAGGLYQQLVLALLREEDAPHDTVIVYMKKAVDSFLAHNQSKALQQFLSKLQTMSNRSYQQACRYIEKDNKTN